MTLGVYYLVWYYKANRELRDYGLASPGASPGGSPMLSLLAITVGWIVLIPPFISMYQTFGRVATAQRIAGLPGEASPLLGRHELLCRVMPAYRQRSAQCRVAVAG